MTENDQKFKKNFFFKKKFDFLSFFYPLTILYILLIYILEKYSLFLRFWYKSFENRIKTQLPAFFFHFWNMNINKKYLNHCELSFYPIFKILAPKSSKKQVVLKKIYFKTFKGVNGSKNYQKLNFLNIFWKTFCF